MVDKYDIEIIVYLLLSKTSRKKLYLTFIIRFCEVVIIKLLIYRNYYIMFIVIWAADSNIHHDLFITLLLGYIA